MDKNGLEQTPDLGEHLSLQTGRKTAARRADSAIASDYYGGATTVDGSLLASLQGRAVRRLAEVAAICAIYYASGRLGLSLALPPGHATAVWPPSGLALAAVLLLGYRIWPGIWLGSFLVNFPDLSEGAGVVALARSAAVASAIGVGSTSQACLGAALIQRLTGSRSPFDRTHDVFKFVTIETLVCVVAPSVGVTSLSLGEFVPWNIYGDTWWTWWLGDVIGALIVTPLLLVWVNQPRIRFGPQQFAEAWLFLVALAGASYLIFWGPFAGALGRYSLELLLIPFLIWAAFRYGQRGVVATGALISIAAITGTAEGNGPFVRETLNASLLALQMFVGIIAVTGLVLATALAERERADEALRESEDRLRSFVHHSADGIVMLREDGRIELVNGAAQRMFGYEPDELLGQPIEVLVPQHARAEHGWHRAGYLRDARPRPMGEGLELRALRKDGREFPVDISLSPLKTADGLLVAAVVGDITERKLAEEQMARRAEELVRANRALEGFSYSISHDLKEPVRTLEAFSQFVLEDYANKLDEQGRDYLRRIGNASARMKQMIDELLTLSRVGRRPAELTRVAVGRVGEEIAEAFQATVQEKGARIDVARDLPAVLGDLTSVEQIFGNLIANGLKFNHSPEPVVRVGLREVTDGMAVFYVQDNGIGIDPQYHEQIFGVFQRLHRREEYEGTGAGLAIVEVAAEALGGRVWLESTPNAGTTFFVSLPLWQERAAPVLQEVA